MTVKEAIRCADKNARKNNEEYFVVYDYVECGIKHYDIATDYDLNTFYQGCRPEHIVYSTEEGMLTHGGIL